MNSIDIARSPGTAGTRTAAARKWWTLAAVCTGVFMLLLDITIVNVALPDIERAFGASLSDLQWVISAYALTLAAFLLTAGSLADLYGRRRLFAIGIVIFTVGSLCCGLATSSLVPRRSREPGRASAARSCSPRRWRCSRRRSRARIAASRSALFGAITGVAVAVGPVLGGAITSGLSWRWIFFVNIPIGVVALLITLLRVDESRNPNADATRLGRLRHLQRRPRRARLRPDPEPAGRLGLDERDRRRSPRAPLLLAAFVVIERIQAEPMFDLGLLRVPTFDGGLIAAWAISASLFSLLTYLVIYMQNILGSPRSQTGVRFLPLTGAIFVSPASPAASPTHVPRRC